MLRVLIATTAIAAGSGCDRFKKVEIVNATDTVLFIDEGTAYTATPTNRARLAPGEVKTNDWMSPLSSTDPPRRVEARDASDTTVFCQRYGYDDLQQAGWRIQVVRSQPSC